MKRIIVVLAAFGLFLVLAAPVFIFFNRPPALVVIDIPFSTLYGTKRMKWQQLLTSLALFRRLQPVLIADGASPDIISIAVKEAARQPCCVIFPRYLASAAERYHAEAPEIPVVLLSSYADIPGFPSASELFYIYRTDIETDMYRAGLMAGGLSRKSAIEEQKTVVYWQDRFIQDKDREFFTEGVSELDQDLTVAFVRSVSELPETGKISCLVLSGAGSEYIDKNPRMPLILFTWLDPSLLSKEVMVVFDDSPWALAVPAVRMAAKNQIEGTISSKPLIFRRKVADNGIFRALNVSAKSLCKRNKNEPETLTNVE